MNNFEKLVLGSAIQRKMLQRCSDFSLRSLDAPAGMHYNKYIYDIHDTAGFVPDAGAEPFFEPEGERYV